VGALRLLANDDSRAVISGAAKSGLGCRGRGLGVVFGIFDFLCQQAIKTLDICSGHYKHQKTCA